MQHVAGGAHGVLVEDLFDRREALAFVADFLGRGEDRRHIDAEGLGRERLELLAKHNGVGATGAHELHLLWRQGRADVNELLVALTKLLGLRVDGEHGTRVHTVDLLKHRLAVGIEDGVALAVDFLDPVLEVHPDASRHAHRGEENGGDAVGACNHGCDVDEGHVFTRLLSNPQRHVVHAGHPRGAHTHGAFFGHEHDALVGMLLLQFEEFVLANSVVLKHGLAVQFAV